MLESGLDRFALVLLDATLSAWIWLGGIALAMVGCRQPGRRRDLARVGVLGSLAWLPLAWLWQAAGFEPLALLRAWIFFPIHLRTDPGPSLPGLFVPLIALYLTGVALGLLGLLLGWWATRWLIRRSSEPSPTTQGLYETLASARKRGGIGRPRLRVSPRVGRPVLVGVFWPTILIPPDLQRPDSADRLRLGLLHELAHADRLDHAFHLLGRLSQAFWYYVPPLWWIRHQLRMDQEFLADRQAAEQIGPLRAYASSLVEMSQAPTGNAASQVPTPLPTGEATTFPLYQRVAMLVRCPFPVESRSPRWWRWLILPTLAGGLLMLSLFSPRVVEAVWTTSLSHRSAGALDLGGSFHLSELRLIGTPGLAEPYLLPLPTPERFDLTVEVLADPESLTQMRLLGIPLHGIENSKGNATPSGPGRIGWRKVRLSRDHDGLRLWIDDDEVLIEPGQSSTPWLSIQQAPGSPTQLRDLQVYW
ncbi:hypothetical protein BH23PLA1_BH23PLA1_04270 [soil metagenome]